MLNEEFVNKSVLDINSLNNAGLTPLDVLLIFQSEAGDREIEEMLRRAGGARARDFSLQSLEADRTATSDLDQGRPQSPAKQLLNYFKYDTIKDSPARVRNTLLVIAVLIATATYQAVLSPPGGVWQDDSNDHVAGKSVMGSHKPIAYSLFLVSNSVGFFTSLHIICLLTNAFPLHLELQISIFALIFTYDTCMTAIAPSSRISIMFTVISIVLPFLAPVLSTGLRNYLKAPRCELPLTSNSNSSVISVWVRADDLSELVIKRKELDHRSNNNVKNPKFKALIFTLLAKFGAPATMLLQAPATATSKAPLFRHRQHGGLSSSFFHSLSFPSRFSSSILPKPLTTASVAITCALRSKPRGRGTVDYERRQKGRWLDIYRRFSSMPDPETGAASVLNQYENEGKKISKFGLSRVVKELRKFRSYKLALGVYEWMENRPERFWMTTSDIAIKLDLISKVHGISSAETYFQKLSDSLTDRRVYGSLLNAYVHGSMKEKAEALFGKMREQGFMTQALSWNVMMSLYMNFKDYGKVDAIVSEMMAKNVPLDMYSYNIWILSLGSQGALEKMEQAFEQMKLDTSITLGWTTFSTMATIYIKEGQLEKADECLKQIERRFQDQGRLPYHYIIGLYGNLGRKEEVHRIWDVYKSKFLNIPNVGYRGVISSLVRSGDIEGAESIFDEWLSKTSMYDPRIGNILLEWYVRSGLTEKAGAFFNKIVEAGVQPNSRTLEILAENHVRVRRISEALSFLKDAFSAAASKNWRPRPATISSILQHCEQANDGASKELLFAVLKQVGCLDDEKYMSMCSGKHTGNELETDDNIDEESERGAELIFSQVH
nr:pentatricopeptide repeat-containing protein At1g02150 [Ipomoea batatas]